MLGFEKRGNYKPMAKHEGKTVEYEGMATTRTVKRFAFDVDGTLIHKTSDGDVPRYEVIELLRTLHSFGHTIFVWSGGGEDYAKMWATKLGLMPLVRILPKTRNYDIDVAFDDHATTLAKVDVIV